MSNNTGVAAEMRSSAASSGPTAGAGPDCGTLSTQRAKSSRGRRSTHSKCLRLWHNSPAKLRLSTSADAAAVFTGPKW